MKQAINTDYGEQEEEEEEAKAVPGMNRHVPRLLKEATWRSCNGPEAKVVRGTCGHVCLCSQRLSGGYSMGQEPGLSLG